MDVLRKFAGLALGFLTIIAGCWNGGGVAQPLYGVTPAYGMPQPPPIPHDPTVTLDDFSYTPPSPARPGDTLEFTATTNKPTEAGRVIVRIGDSEINRLEFVYLNDEGYTPDDIANDGIWTGEYELAPDEAPGENIPVTSLLSWMDGADGQELTGEDLTIEEGGE